MSGNKKVECVPGLICFMLNELCINGFAKIFELDAADSPEGLHVYVLGVM